MRQYRGGMSTASAYHRHLRGVLTKVISPENEYLVVACCAPTTWHVPTLHSQQFAGLQHQFQRVLY